MKIDIKHFALAAAGATMLLTSCIGDLDTLPLNPSDSTSETVYGKDENGYLAGLTKLYFNFVSNDTTDLQVSDGGASELIRAFWTIQEVTADACKCAWENDAWVRAMNTDTWSDADNDATYAVYVRTLQGIAYVSEYLRQTASDKLSDRGVSSELAARIQSFRAEARFLRAYFYWIALDVFGDVPFTTETSPFGGGVNPKQASRKDVFDYCISELTDLASDESAMPAARSNYPRADKGAVNGLLAHMDRRDLQLVDRLELQPEVQPELTRAEYLRLLGAARALDRERTYLLVKLFVLTGLRVGEVPHVTVAAVESGRMKAAGPGGKTGYRSIPTCLREELQNYLRRTGVSTGQVFVTRNGRPMRRTQISMEIRALSQTARVAEEKCNPRCLRKLYQATQAEIDRSVRLLAEQAWDRMMEDEQLTVGWDAEKGVRDV